MTVPVRHRLDAEHLGGALDAWGRFSGRDGRESAPGEWIRADGELMRARTDRTELDLLSVDASRFVVHRTADYTARVSGTGTGHIVVVQLDGHSTLFPGDGHAPVNLGPGSVSYGDPRVTYRWEFDGPMTVMLLRLPAAALPYAPGALRPLLGSPFTADRGFAHLAVGFAQQILADDTMLSGANGPRILHHAVANFETMLAERLNAAEPEDQAQPAMQRALAHISANLDQPLTTQTIAEASGMSPRTLQALFQQRGLTVSGWVKERRLETARQALADPLRADADLTSIALAHGFADHSHFTRNFRRTYGETPSAWRARSTRGLLG